VISPTQKPLPEAHNTHIHARGGIEPTIQAGEQPQTYALERAATGIDLSGNILQKFKKLRYTFGK